MVIPRLVCLFKQPEEITRHTAVTAFGQLAQHAQVVQHGQ
jgi:hypothetical protein